MTSPDTILDILEDDTHPTGSPPSPSIMAADQQISNPNPGSSESAWNPKAGTEEEEKKKKKKKTKKKKAAADGSEEVDEDGEKTKTKKKKTKKGEKTKKKKKAKKEGGEAGSLITEPLLGREEEGGEHDEYDEYDEKDEKEPEPQLRSPGGGSKARVPKVALDRPPEYGGEQAAVSQFNQSSISDDAEEDENQVINGGGGGAARRDALRLDNRRWFVLGVFCLASFSAMLVWSAISAASDVAEEYYDISAATVELTRYWSVYLFPPLALLSSWILSLEKGVKYAVVEMGLCPCIGATFMIIPSFVGKVEGDVSYAGKLGPTSSFGHFLVHFGLIVNAFATTMVFCAPCALSAAWFPAYQRRLATAIGGLIPMMAGLALCSVLSPLIANKEENFFWLLLIIFLCSLVIMIATFVVPALPRTPPSHTAARYRMSFVPTQPALQQQQQQQQPQLSPRMRRVNKRRTLHSISTSSMQGQSSGLASMALEESRAGRAVERLVAALRRTLKRYVDLFLPLRNPGPRRLAVTTFLIAMALLFACLYVWQISLTHVLISSKSAGTLGRASLLSLSHLVSACGVAFIVAWLCDHYFKRKARIIICGAQIVFAFLLILLLGLCLSPPSAIPEFLISKEFVIFHLVCIGVTVGATTPLLYDLCCEVLYPIPEAVALTIPVFFGSFVGIVVAATSPHISESSFGTVICVLSICESLLSAALIYFGSFKLPYFRLDVDERRCDSSDYQQI